jgi:ketosteroid isomerase-like protein
MGETRKFKMTKLLVLCTVILVISVGVLTYFRPGQLRIVSVAEMTETTDSATAQREIHGILEEYYELARRNDHEALKKFSEEISAPEYQYSSEIGVMDKAATLRFFDSLEVEFLSAEFEDLTVQIHGNVAIAIYRDVSQISSNGDFMKTPMRFTNVWVKRDGKWRIVAEHSSEIAPPRELLPKHPLADNFAEKQTEPKSGG